MELMEIQTDVPDKAIEGAVWGLCILAGVGVVILADSAFALVGEPTDGVWMLLTGMLLGTWLTDQILEP